MTPERLARYPRESGREAPTNPTSPYLRKSSGIPPARCGGEREIDDALNVGPTVETCAGAQPRDCVLPGGAIRRGRADLPEDHRQEIELLRRASCARNHPGLAGQARPGAGELRGRSLPERPEERQCARQPRQCAGGPKRHEEALASYDARSRSGPITSWRSTIAACR